MMIHALVRKRGAIGRAYVQPFPVPGSDVEVADLVYTEWFRQYGKEWEWFARVEMTATGYRPFPYTEEQINPANR